MDIGFDKPLYILPFDHRGSFQTNMFGWKGEPTPAQTAEIAASKQLVYEGFKAAVAAGLPRDKGGILADEQYGAAILRDAQAHGFITCCPVEESERDEFDFEFGDDFARHIEEFKPTFCKALIRYNVEGDAALNKRGADRLKRLSDYLRPRDPWFMLEILILATPAQLAKRQGDNYAFDRLDRPRLMIQGIQQLQDAGIEADVWKLEGLDDRADCERVVAAVRRGGRERVSCVVLGRGEDGKRVRGWLTTAAAVPGFTGFAVGRTTFWEPLAALREKKITREAAIADIARRYRDWADIFEKAKGR